MELKTKTDSLFDDAIEAAYVMQETEELYGRDSKELEQAFEDYQKAVNKYYKVSGTGKNDFWTSFCDYNPSCAECLIYDTWSIVDAWSMVKILYVLDGKRHEEIVPWRDAKFKNRQLFYAGAAVYWSEFC